MDVLRRYRTWKRRHLVPLGLALGASFGGAAYLAWGAPGSPGIRLVSGSVAALLGLLLGYLLLQTLRCDHRHLKLERSGARPLRRELRPTGPVAFASVLFLGVLVLVPRWMPRPPGEWGRVPEAHPAHLHASRLSRREAPEPTPVAPPRELPGAEAPRQNPPAPPEVPHPEAPRPEATAVAPQPEIRPILALEPQPLELDGPGASPEPRPKPAEPRLRDLLAEEPRPLGPAPEGFTLPVWPDPPAPLPQEAALVEQETDPERRRAPERYTLEAFREATLQRDRDDGKLVRAMPDEIFPDEMPSPEIRIDGILLFGRQDYGKAPALTLAFDFPFTPGDSVEIAWLALDLPHPADSTSLNPHDLPDWNHVTANYTRRLAGYTKHALFDLAVSLGASVDLIGAVKGLSVVDSSPKFSPYIGLDTAFWQDGAMGLLAHVGESIPVAIGGSSVGVTDVEALVRLDVSPQISLHAGYRFLFLRFKETPALVPVGEPNQPYSENLSGPVLGIDIRF